MQNLFFISEAKPEEYPEVGEHYKWIGIHDSNINELLSHHPNGNITYEIFSELHHIYKPLAIYNYGSHKYHGLLSSVYAIRRRCIHLENLDPIDPSPIVFAAIMGKSIDHDHPLMSIITTSFNSKHKILRPLRSLQLQTYKEWEWIIWDDSPDEITYKELLELQKKDLRIRVFKAPNHSGSIGEMKRMACGSARGKFLVEIDHDDDFHPNLLKWIFDASIAHPEANFFFTDSAEVHEDTYEGVSYGDSFGRGYSIHINVWCELLNCYVTSAICPWPNPVTMGHIVGVPNHVRVWKAEFYEKIGKHNPELYVADDYDLLVRSFIANEGKDWCHIRACGYYQYRNKDGNFTFIRNALIQHNTRYIHAYHSPKLPKPNEDDVYPSCYEPRWKTDTEFYKKKHIDYIPPEYDYQITVALFDPTKEEIIKKIVEFAKESTPKSFHIYVMGKLPDGIPTELKKHISWWDLESKNYDDRVRCVKYFYHTSGELILPPEEVSSPPEQKFAGTLLQINIDTEDGKRETKYILVDPSHFNLPLNISDVKSMNLLDVKRCTTIITPCIRQENLKEIYKSIQFDKIDKWIICYDTTRLSFNFIFNAHPKIEEYRVEGGVSGNPQRNYGLSKAKDGIIYFLDDDNIIHPGFWSILSEVIERRDVLVTFNQQRDQEGKVLLGNNIKPRAIDTAMFIMDKSLTQGFIWDEGGYFGDGYFIQKIYEKFKDQHKYINRVGCYYNYLTWEKYEPVVLSLDTKKVAITTLTCNDRKTIFSTIDSFLQNTDLSLQNTELEWYILLQGCSQEHLHQVKKHVKSASQIYDITFRLSIIKENLGLSKGVNILAEKVKNYEYVLYIEDDWLCLPKEITQCSSQWFKTCINLMQENADIDTLFLRKYVDSKEKEQFAWSKECHYNSHIFPLNFNYSKKMKGSHTLTYRDVKFQHIPEFLFSFNPCIRRNSTYYKCGVFPLPEYEDSIQTNGEWTLTQYDSAPQWGWCEANTMEKIRDTKTYNVASGIFGHYEHWIANKEAKDYVTFLDTFDGQLEYKEKITCIVDREKYCYFKEYLENVCIDLDVIFDAPFSFKNAKVMFVQTIPETVQGLDEASFIGLINTEQLTVPHHRIRFENSIKRVENLHLYDFSQSNIKLVQDLYEMKHLPFIDKIYPLRETSLTELFQNTEKKFDVVIIGSLSVSSRRNNIVRKLIEYGVKVHVVIGWGLERDIEVAKASVLLNIHFSEEYQIFEEIRCNRWLYAGMTVFSEKSIHQNFTHPNLKVYNYDEIVHEICRYLNRI